MAKNLKVTKKHNPGIYDSETGKDCVAEKVVNITSDCPGASKQNGCILIFTRAKRGRIVQIRQGCSNVHFFVGELDSEMRVAPRDDTFGSRANMLGLDKSALRELIEMHAPSA